MEESNDEKEDLFPGDGIPADNFLLTGCGGQKTGTLDNADANITELADENGGFEQPTIGGKMVVNFEGRVTAVKDDIVTLEDGKTVCIGDSTCVSAPDGNSVEIAINDYIQGYAENPEDSEINALSILVTAL